MSLSKNYESELGIGKLGIGKLSIQDNQDIHEIGPGNYTYGK